jgi:hypothetical protein
MSVLGSLIGQFIVRRRAEDAVRDNDTEYYFKRDTAVSKDVD